MSTQPSPARFIVPAVAFTLAAIVLGVVFTGGGGRTPTPPPSGDAPAETTADTTAETAAGNEGEAPEAAAPETDPPAAPAAPAAPGAASPAAPAADGDDAAAPPADAAAAADGAPAIGPAVPPAPIAGLRAVAPDDADVEPTPIGSLDPTDPVRMRVQFSRNGAGISKIAFADIWETAVARRQARAWYEAGGADQTQVEPPDEAMRYILAASRTLRNTLEGRSAGTTIPELAANQIEINGTRVPLLRSDADLAGGLPPVWSEVGPGQFQTIIIDGEGTAMVRIERTYELSDNYDLTLRQRVFNLTDAPLEIRWWQYGPGDLRVDRARYMDRRRYRFGVGVPGTEGGIVLQAPSGKGGLIEHQTLEKREELDVWPSRQSVERNWTLSWFAVTNRYFGFAVHPPMAADGSGALTLEDRVERIIHEKSYAPLQPGERARVEEIFVYLASPLRTVAPGEELNLDLGVFAGPLDADVLGDDPRYSTLRMEGMILYQMSAFCAICTFQWLAHALLGFLGILHDTVLFDWGLAIIVLVVVVRSILHPITKKSQVGMQRFGKAMVAMKPEIEKLQKKYKDDPKRIQVEQVRLMREHGVSPMSALGCLPMFLQTPIWIALYAMLYFAFDLRQEPAFFGVFQAITGGSWAFLSDLSSGDHFFFELDEPRRFLFFNITGGNLLPLLLGGVFYFQQKYMTPPTAATLSPEQQQQQKIMKFMMVVLFPIMLYSAPSGLVLYIITSSTIGILESRYIRSHVEQLDKKREAEGGPTTERKEGAGLQALLGGKRKNKDPQARAYADALDARRKKLQDKQRGSSRSYKRRK
jgi:YidC/Oxa1 family membrane protein insertase